jgi:CDP-diacylglycerol--glycerol-3-phosphate 3-phosphatidyltransferase
MKWNLPNKLTVLRIFMIPFFVFFLMAKGGTDIGMRFVSLLIFIAAGLTDMLDGKIARKYNMITNFGKFMDPLADKMLVSSALICFVQLLILPAWVVILIIAREFIISGFRLVASDQGKVIAASMWGKSKTVSQMITCGLLILNIKELSAVTNVCVIIMVILTMVSLVDYLYKNRGVLKEGNA